MGCQQSKQKQQPQDVLVEHTPPLRILSEDAGMRPCFAGMTFNVEVSKRCWETETDVGGEEGGGLQLAPYSVPIRKDNSRTLMLQRENSERGMPKQLLAVLVMQDPQKLDFQIYSLRPSTPQQKASRELEGNKLYQFANVKDTQKHRDQLILNTITEPAETNTSGTEYRTRLRGNIHASASARAAARTAHQFVIQRHGVVCATVEESREGWNPWKCTIAAGVDPALMICFVACYSRVYQAKQSAFDACPDRVAP